MRDFGAMKARRRLNNLSRCIILLDSESNKLTLRTFVSRLDCAWDEFKKSLIMLDMIWNLVKSENAHFLETHADTFRSDTTSGI